MGARGKMATGGKSSGSWTCCGEALSNLESDLKANFEFFN